VTKAGIVGLKLCFGEFVAVEIDERNLAMQELIGKTRLVNKEFCVAVMARPFGHNDGCRSKPEEGFRRSTDELHVSVDWSSGNVFDDIRLEENGFPVDV
jgi:hypothetical protein